MFTKILAPLLSVTLVVSSVLPSFVLAEGLPEAESIEEIILTEETTQELIETPLPELVLEEKVEEKLVKEEAPSKVVLPVINDKKAEAIKVEEKIEEVQEEQMMMAASVEYAVIPDANMKAALNNLLGRGYTQGDILIADLNARTGTFNAPTRSITDLTGIEHLTGVITFNLHNNQITDASPLYNLTNARTISLYGNQLTNIDGFSGHPSLQSLRVDSNNLTSVALDNIPKLTTLFIEKNEPMVSLSIKNMPLMANTSTAFKMGDTPNLESVEFVNNPNMAGTLSLSHRKISQMNFSGMNGITSISLINNNLTDISALSGLNLTGFADFSNNNISDISPLAGMTGLVTRLRLDNNNITDILPLAGMTKLKQLDLSNNHISDITALSNLTELTNLQLQYNLISDTAPLIGLTKISSGSLVYNLIYNVDAWRSAPGNKFSTFSTTNNFIPGQYQSFVLSMPNEVYQVNVGDEISVPISWGSRSLTQKQVDGMNNTLSSLNGNEISSPVWDPTLRNITVTFSALEEGLDTITYEPIPGFTGTFRVNVSDIDAVVNIPDNNLKSFINGKLGRTATAEIWKSELKTFTTLDLSNLNISDLTGLEEARNLTELNAEGNSITSVANLSLLRKLTVLDVSDNQLTNVTGLQGLANLTSLDVSGNSLLSFFSIKNIKSLKTVNASRNNLSNTNGAFEMTNLTHLNVSDNQLTDASGLSGSSIETLIADRNLLTNVDFASSMVSLSSFTADSNKLANIEGLSGRDGLDSLSLRNNLITSLAPITGLPNFANFVGSGAFDENFIDDGTPKQYTFTVPANQAVPENTQLVLPVRWFFDGEEITTQPVGISRSASSANNVFTVERFAFSELNGYMELTLLASSIGADTITVRMLPEYSKSFTATSVETPISVPDSNFKRCINEMLGKGPTLDDVFRTELTAITTIDCSFRDISSIEGFQYFTRLTHVSDNAFEGNNLTSITLPSSAVSIGDRAFADNKLVSVSVRNGVSVSSAAFDDNFLDNAVYGNQYNFTVPTETIEVEYGENATFQIRWTYNGLPYTGVTPPKGNHLTPALSSVFENDLSALVWNETTSTHDIHFTANQTGTGQITVQMSEGYSQSFTVKVMTTGVNEFRDIQDVNIGNVQMKEGYQTVAMPGFVLEKTLDGGNWTASIQMDEIRNGNGDVVKGMEFAYTSDLTVSKVEGSTLTPTTHNRSKLNGNKLVLFNGTTNTNGIWNIGFQNGAVELKTGATADLSAGYDTFSTTITYEITELD